MTENHDAWTRKLAEGDEQAFAELYHAYSGNIFRVAMMYGKQNEDRAKELVQIVFVRVWEKHEKFAGVHSIEDFLFILARNTIYNFLRNESRTLAREKTYQSNRADEQNDADHPLLAKEYARVFQNAVDQLPPQQKKIWVMAKEEGLSHTEIADRLSLAKSTVHTHVKLGLRSIRGYVKKSLFFCYLLVIIVVSS